MIFLKKLLINLTVLYFCAILCACSSMQPATQAALNQQQTWETRNNQLSQITQWNIKGALGINDSKQAWSSSVYWQQFNQNNFNLRLFGPIGVGTLDIKGTPSQTTLTTAQNKTFTAENVDLLLEQQTGWLLPISNLYYWVRGIPVPNLPADEKFDDYHHLTELSQQGWNIQFQRYTSVNGIDLPSKIFLQYQQFKIRLIVSQWKF